MMRILRLLATASVLSLSLAVTAFADPHVQTGKVAPAPGDNFVLVSKTTGDRYLFYVDKNSGYRRFLTRAAETGAELTIIGNSDGAAAPPGSGRSAAAHGYRAFSLRHVLAPGKSGIETGKFLTLGKAQGAEEDQSYYLNYLDGNGVKRSMLGAGVLPSFYRLEDTKRYKGKELKIYWDTIGPMKAAVYVEVTGR